jgi:DNA end-binding protein Ku
VAKFILRDTQHLAAVEVIDDAIVLSVMRFADELVDESQLTFPPSKGHPEGRARHGQGPGQQPGFEWDPSKYTDEYRANLMRIIEGKTKGKEVALEAAEEPRQAEVVDLMERLKRSLERSPARARAAGGGKTATKRAPSRKARKRRAA